MVWDHEGEDSTSSGPTTLMEIWMNSLYKKTTVRRGFYPFTSPLTVILGVLIGLAIVSYFYGC